jgi:hypothetical protein
MFRSLHATMCCMALACAVPSAVKAADACYWPQPAACYPPQSASSSVMESPVADEGGSQSVKEQTVALACPVPHAGAEAATHLPTHKGVYAESF